MVGLGVRGLCVCVLFGRGGGLEGSAWGRGGASAVEAAAAADDVLSGLCTHDAQPSFEPSCTFSP